MVEEHHLIDQHAGFRSDKSTTGHLLNLTQYIKDGYLKKKITGADFVDLTAIYDTFNHRRFLTKILQMTKDSMLTTFLDVMLRNLSFFVEFNNKKRGVRLQKNGLPQGSVFAPPLDDIYRNDQSQDLQTKQFIYADDLCNTCQDIRFEPVEKTLSNALNQLKDYYNSNNLRANPSKTQACAFHLKNKYANKQLTII